MSEVNYVRDLYQEVIKSFPELKEDEIKLASEPCERYISGYLALNAGKTKKEPDIGVGRYFFLLTREEQEGAIAHEIGHHETVKNYTIPRLKRRAKLIRRCNENLIPLSRPHWKERLQKFYILNETAADNKVAETKYGKYQLGYYKKYALPSDEIGQILIANLEARIGEENV